MRVIHQDDPGHPDNHGYVVSHVGLNKPRELGTISGMSILKIEEVFKQWIAAGQDEEEIESGEGHPRRFDGGMLVRTRLSAIS